MEKKGIAKGTANINQLLYEEIYKMLQQEKTDKKHQNRLDLPYLQFSEKNQVWFIVVFVRILCKFFPEYQCSYEFSAHTARS